MPENPSANMTEYYARRAGEYEKIYHKPERQEDLARLRADLPPLFCGLDVLEIACGTGYWTSLIAKQARTVLATDVGEEVLAIARAKAEMPGTVTFARADAFSLEGVNGAFSAAMVGFWWSHVLLENREAFLEVLRTKLMPDALVVMVDNRHVPDSSTAVCRTDDQGNTHQLRTLQDGSRFEVVKNYDTQQSIRTAVDRVGTLIRFEELEYYWWCAWRMKPRRCHT